MTDFRFQTTVESHKLKSVLALAGTEWSGKLTAQEFGDLEAKSLVDFILRGNPGRAFYLESNTGDIVASCVVTQHKALFKEAGATTIGTVPDPSSFGVKNTTAIRLSYVFVAKEARGKGLMGTLLSKTIEYTEAEILKKELAKSSDKKDSFRSMVQNGKHVDQTLVRHYLGKKYVWYLYSAIGPAYSKFGFKSYPVEGYKISGELAHGKSYSYVEKLLSDDRDKDAGKKLRLLDGTEPSDRALIDSILQGKQLELLTDLNKNVYHSELQGDSRSSSSLTNLSSALLARRSSGQLSAVTMKFKETVLGDPGQSSQAVASDAIQDRRKSSILSLGCSKFAVLPEFQDIDHKFAGQRVTAEKAGTAENRKYASIYGAVLTNELQNKSFYVLWMPVKGQECTIIAMGELKNDIFETMTSAHRRRSSSFTAINEMGGHNFQDLDLLVNTAVYVAKRQALSPGGGSVHVSVNDLPTSIPRPVLHDFLLNYVPKAYEGQGEKELVKFIADFAEIQILPMLRKYGARDASDANFELDWVANSLITWG